MVLAIRRVNATAQNWEGRRWLAKFSLEDTRQVTEDMDKRHKNANKFMLDTAIAYSLKKWLN